MLQHLVSIKNKRAAMNIIKVKEEDLSDIMNLLRECIADMQAHRIDQWDEFYPTEDKVTENIQNQTLYGVKDEQNFLAVITLDTNGAPEYDAVKWLTEDGDSLFVHRLAVHPKWQRRKIATKLMDFSEAFAKKNNYTSIRLDVYSRNFRAVGLYESCGYKRIGQVHFRHKEPPFLCYEKILCTNKI
ncbi:MAG: GNAT family N-acetyltransferase [Planctomycetota bacterium]|jgi:ribosomal protein S18 acetylase RimI-like enzyme